ncbi:MAG: ATP-dependent DNA helicase RecG [Eubacteriales bacterium]
MTGQTPVSSLRGVGTARAKAFEKLGITQAAHLLRFYPRAYEDRQPRGLLEVPVGEAGAFVLTVNEEPKIFRKPGLSYIKFTASDSSGELCSIVFFNQNYVKDILKRDKQYRFYGRLAGNLIKHELVNPKFDPWDEQAPGERFSPIYPLTQGLTPRAINDAVKQALDGLLDTLSDPLSDILRQEYSLCHLSFAIKQMHQPTDEHTLSTARHRLAFEELFLYQLGLMLLRGQREARGCAPMDTSGMERFYSALPFPLTGAQRRAVDAGLTDLSGTVPMNRLIQGDVGSGKTAIAAALIYCVCKNGAQASLMAPTEILATQHLESLTPLLEGLGIRCALLTGSTKAAARRTVLSAVKEGEIGLLIGTHAIIQDGVDFRNLRLVVTDEQHRFGVEQRARLADKSQGAHVLVMSATPIPRTLALMMYGDLDISVVDELPPGRQSVDTFFVNSTYRQRIYKFIRKLIGEGRQCYIVCPLVEDEASSPEDDRKAAVEYAETLRQDVFPDLSIGCMHGRLSPSEKDEVMRRFMSGEDKILVSTTVIEVGVNVPNAALMLVENAERFGLSQLHQLRGRVGRGSHKSYCVLMSDNDSPATKERLEIMTKTGDGFKIAQRDLELRGPGDFFGSRQSGSLKFRVANLSMDMKLLYTANEAAKRLISSDPLLERDENAALKKEINEIVI